MEEHDRGLGQIREWMRANKLRLDPDKTEVLVVGPYSNLGSGSTMVLGGVTHILRDQVRSWISRWWMWPGESAATLYGKEGSGYCHTCHCDIETGLL